CLTRANNVSTLGGVKTTLISIGNSRGVRIPKPLIEQCGLSGTVEMDVRDSMILIRSPRQARSGWGEAFRQMARLDDDRLLDTPPTRWDSEDWEWR
ncbi:MAG: hypothetical protein ACOYM3_23965, partial [Terrimicrobiaceae bacterium]